MTTDVYALLSCADVPEVNPSRFCVSQLSPSAAIHFPLVPFTLATSSAMAAIRHRHGHPRLFGATQSAAPPVHSFTSTAFFSSTSPIPPTPTSASPTPFSGFPSAFPTPKVRSDVPSLEDDVLKRLRDVERSKEERLRECERDAAEVAERMRMRHFESERGWRGPQSAERDSEGLSGRGESANVSRVESHRLDDSLHEALKAEGTSREEQIDGSLRENSAVSPFPQAMLRSQIVRPERDAMRTARLRTAKRAPMTATSSSLNTSQTVNMSGPMTRARRQNSSGNIQW